MNVVNSLSVYCLILERSVRFVLDLVHVVEEVSPDVPGRWLRLEQVSAWVRPTVTPKQKLLAEHFVMLLDQEHVCLVV